MTGVQTVTVAEGEGWEGGMTGNSEDIALAASTRTRNGEDDNLQWHFSGELGNVAMFDRPLEDIEAVFLAEGGGDPNALAPLYAEYVAPETSEADEEAPVEEEATEDDGEAGETEEQAAEPEEEEEQPAAEEAEVTEEEEEEGEEQPVFAEEEDAGEEGVFAVIAQLFMMIFTLFGLLGGGSRSEEVDEALDEAEDLLSGIVPSTGEMDETMPDGMQEDDDAMMEAA